MGGDTVKAGKAFLPEVEFQGTWYPICQSYFTGNEIGAKAVCKALGFAGGSLKKRAHDGKIASGYEFNINAMPVGKCENGYTLDQCEFRRSRKWGEVDCGSCHCQAGKSVGVKVICTDALSPGSCRS